MKSTALSSRVVLKPMNCMCVYVCIKHAPDMDSTGTKNAKISCWSWRFSGKCSRQWQTWDTIIGTANSWAPKAAKKWIQYNPNSLKLFSRALLTDWEIYFISIQKICKLPKEARLHSVQQPYSCNFSSYGYFWSVRNTVHISPFLHKNCTASTVSRKPPHLWIFCPIYEIWCICTLVYRILWVEILTTLCEAR